MERLVPFNTESWPDPSFVFGLAIQVNSGTRQLHTSVLYRFDGRLMIGDLLCHLSTRREEARPSNRLLWIAPDLTQHEQEILAAKVDAWLEENGNMIPYSVAHPGGVIFRDDIWVGHEPGQGLTCATFVVALFDELGIPFIDIETWESREGDAEWANNILAAMSPYMKKEHIDAQLERLGETARVRPNDVTAAGLLIHQGMNEPLRFEQVDPVSVRVEAALFS